jgi:CRP-like cAMP-binding protein
MTSIEHPSYAPEPYDFEFIVPRRQMANKRTLGFSSTVFRKKFRTGMSVRNYRDNEVVFSQGDTADAVFYIQSGTVKLTVGHHASQESCNRCPSAG